MALEYFGWFVPKVASGPKPHPEEVVRSPTQILYSHLSHCYLFQAGLQLQPTLLSCHCCYPSKHGLTLLCHMINPKSLAGIEF